MPVDVMIRIECPKCGASNHVTIGATSAERVCGAGIARGGFCGYRFTVQDDRCPIPTQEYDDEFLAHAATTTSQYDRTCRVLAAEVIRDRTEIIRLRAMIPTCDRGPKACDAEIALLKARVRSAEDTIVGALDIVVDNHMSVAGSPDRPAIHTALHQLFVALRGAEREAERARVALESINEIVAVSMADEELVEHIIDPKSHGPEETKAHYRGMAKQMRAIDEVCSAFFFPIVEAMESRAESAASTSSAGSTAAPNVDVERK